MLAADCELGRTFRFEEIVCIWDAVCVYCIEIFYISVFSMRMFFTIDDIDGCVTQRTSSSADELFDCGVVLRLRSVLALHGSVFIDMLVFDLWFLGYCTVLIH